MKAHIIPESYLKGFVDPNTPQGHDPSLHLYDFSTQSWKRRAPQKALRQTDYYALPGMEGDEKDALDHGPMGAIEGRAAQLVRTKIEAKSPLSFEEKRDYAEFIGLMMGRVPAHRARMDHLIGEAYAQPWLMMAQYNPERYRRMVEAYERDTGQKAPSLADWRMLEEGKIRFHLSQWDHVQGMAGVLDAVTIPITKMRWVFFHTSPPNWFITSDNPVSLRVPNHPEWGFGLRRKDIQLTFPVTRSIGLLACWGQDTDSGAVTHIDLPAVVETALGETIPIGEEPLRAANLLQIGYCSQYVVAPSGQFPCVEMLDEKAGIPAFFHDLASGAYDDTEDMNAGAE